MDNSEKSTQNLSAEGILTAKVHRKYLHSNSTSHTWPFSAIAELIDNAYDADVEARRLRIDVEDISAEKCLSFTDDGRGMTPDKLYRMLSFGFCDKEGADGGGGGGGGRIRGSTRSQVPLGQYGNGFKSGSMRLGKDALVFTRASVHPVPLGDGWGGGKRSIASGGKTMSVGFLSQTFLEEIRSEIVLVPIVTWNADTKESMQSIGDRSIDYILSHSIFSSSEELFEQFDLIESETGTRIIIYNLTKGLDTLFEMDFDANLYDICLNPGITETSERTTNDGSTGELPLYRTSLKEYCAILFLYSRLTIVLRKREVKSKRLLPNLIKRQNEIYKPKNQDKKIMISFGMWDKERAFTDNDYGALYYYKNRLIKAYEKIGCQKKNEGVGVIAILEIPHDIESIVPVHNKQEFLESSRFSSLVKELSKKLNSYCIDRGLKVTASHTNARNRSTAREEDDDNEDEEDGHRNRKRLKTKRPKPLNVKDLLKDEKVEDLGPMATTISSSSNSLAQSPLATSRSRAPLATSLMALSFQLSAGSISSSSAGVVGGSWMADASSGKYLLPGPGGGVTNDLVPPAIGSDDETHDKHEESEIMRKIPDAAEIVVVNETQPDAFPSSAATVAMPTVSMESAEAGESSVVEAAAAAYRSAESRDPDRRVTTWSADGDMTSSDDVRQKVMTSSDDVRQEAEPSDIRAFSLGDGGDRESKFVQTDDAAADDVTFRRLPTVARQLELLRLNVSRLLSRSRRVLLPGLSVDRLEDVDSALVKFLLEESIDDDGGQRTAEGRRFQTKTEKQERKEQDDDETSSNDDVKHDVIKVLPRFEGFRLKESDSADATEAKIMTSEEKSSLDDVIRQADDQVPVAEERTTWHSRLSLCRQPLHSYSSIGPVTPKSKESSSIDRATPTSTSKKRERISSRIEEFFSFSFKRQRNDD